jgi:hypothetical protein
LTGCISGNKEKKHLLITAAQDNEMSGKIFLVRFLKALRIWGCRKRERGYIMQNPRNKGLQ